MVKLAEASDNDLHVKSTVAPAAERGSLESASIRPEPVGGVAVAQYVDVGCAWAR
jgi:hypothetical protein